MACWRPPLASLAEHELRAGDAAAAARHQRESMYLAAELAAPILLGSAFVLAARLAEQLDLADTAIRLHGAADVLYEDAGFELVASDQALSDAMRSRVLAQLGPERVGALTREGRALDHRARHRAGRGGVRPGGRLNAPFLDTRSFATRCPTSAPDTTPIVAVEPSSKRRSSHLLPSPRQMVRLHSGGRRWATPRGRQRAGLGGRRHGAPGASPERMSLVYDGAATRAAARGAAVVRRNGRDSPPGGLYPF